MRTLTLAFLLANTIATPVLAQEPEERVNARMEQNDTHQSDGGDSGGRSRNWGGGDGGQAQARSIPAPVQPAREAADPGNGRRDPFGGGFGGGGRPDGNGGGNFEAGIAAQPAPVIVPVDRGFRGNIPDQPPQVTPQPLPGPQFGGFGGGGRDGARDGNRNGNGDDGRREGWGERRWGGAANPVPPAVPQQDSNQPPAQRADNRGWRSDRSPGSGGWQPGRRDGDRGGDQGHYDGRNRNGGYDRNYDGDSGRDRNRYGDRNRHDNNRWAYNGGRPRDWNYGGYDKGYHWNGRNDRWDRGWRSNSRYNWYNYRSYNRNHYRAQRYYNPYGYSYGYNRFSIGIYLNSLFYSSSYWINDPWSYRLPAATWPYRWVRYYDDVLLVDVRNGYVVDAIYGFFW